MSPEDRFNCILCFCYQERDELRDEICKMIDEKGGVTARLEQLKVMLEKLTYERDNLRGKHHRIGVWCMAITK